MANANRFQPRQYVIWDWGTGTATGQIKQRFEQSVTRTIDDSEITRNGSDDNPAYLIHSDNGHDVLKLGSEIRADSDRSA